MRDGKIAALEMGCTPFREKSSPHLTRGQRIIIILVEKFLDELKNNQLLNATDLTIG